MTRIAYDIPVIILILAILASVINDIILGQWWLLIPQFVLLGCIAFFIWRNHREKSKKHPATQKVFIFTGSHQQIEEAVSFALDDCIDLPFFGANMARLEDPSELVGDLFGTDPQVWEALCELNPGLEEKLRQRVDDWLGDPGFFYEGRLAAVFVHCEAGWHRSVAVGEKLAEIFKEKGHPAITTHLGADNDR